MKKAMVVLAVLAMAVSGCDTGLQDEIDDLKNKNKELEQKLAASEEQLRQDNTDNETKLAALKIALAANNAAKVASAKIDLMNAGYTEDEADSFLANAETMRTEITAKQNEIDTLNQTIIDLRSQVPTGQALEAQKALEWINSPERRLNGAPIGLSTIRTLRSQLLGRIYEGFSPDSFSVPSEGNCTLEQAIEETKMFYLPDIII